MKIFSNMLKSYLLKSLIVSIIKISTTNIFNTRGSELIGSILKKTFIIKVKKKKKKIIIISFLKYLEASLKFIKTYYCRKKLN